MDEDQKRTHLEKMHQARREQARQRAMNRTHKTCPDCVREGNPDPLPLGEFWVVHSDEYSDKQRISAYCKRHQMARQAARQDPSSPDYDPDFHDRRKAAKRGWAVRKRAERGATTKPEISLREAAKELCVSAPTVKNWQRAGRLPTPLTRAAVEALAQQPKRKRRRS